MPLTATKSFCRDRTCQLRLVRPVTDRQTTTTTTTTPRLTPPSQAHPRPAKILAPPNPRRQNPCAASPATPKSLRRHAKTLILPCRTAIFDTSVPSLRSGTDNRERRSKLLALHTRNPSGPLQRRQHRVACTSATATHGGIRRQRTDGRTDVDDGQFEAVSLARGHVTILAKTEEEERIQASCVTVKIVLTIFGKAHGF